MKQYSHSMAVTVLMAVIAVLFAGSAGAETRDRGAYLGLRLVGSALQVDNHDQGFDVDHGGGGAVFFGGYSFSPVFSLELDMTGLNHDTSGQEIAADFRAVQVFAHYRFMPGNAFRPYVKGGLGFYTVNLKADGGDLSVNGGGIPAGVGFDYFVSRHVSFGGDLTHNVILFEDAGSELGDAFSMTDDGDMSSIGLSLTYYF